MQGLPHRRRSCTACLLERPAWLAPVPIISIKNAFQLAARLAARLAGRTASSALLREMFHLCDDLCCDDSSATAPRQLFPLDPVTLPNPVHIQFDSISHIRQLDQSDQSSQIHQSDQLTNRIAWLISPVQTTSVSPSRTRPSPDTAHSEPHPPAPISLSHANSSFRFRLPAACRPSRLARSQPRPGQCNFHRVFLAAVRPPRHRPAKQTPAFGCAAPAGR
ncbi:uncharacterized protein BJ171DRAFT_237499 [Polychytrium aggregatum]|uniref:uncharacterized protein n=1 Tax=Polychytrium aggregatum TaxID=110093 RepID=UPI0022FECF7A|nr:uncharacterized protein BJ171DRAFT_237499 [Polychytrium aggregatum]KAI9208274.1 hypothetical protein BJ171DRAFT_237499 [Polychytrium aggregatum]